MASGRQITIDFIGNDRSLSSTARSATSSTSKLGTSLANVGKMASKGLAVAVVAAGVALVGMTKNAIADEAAQRKLALGLKNSVGATDAVVASVEKWISAQGVALGVTDDELRPAFQRLVQATGDVGEAQRQMGIAMDVSAGTGKSLKVVTEAMMKANNGSTSALSKLGLKTKDAEGNTLSLKDALKTMSDTFKGQAAASADTLEGKMGRLKLMFDEAKETIGSKMIPIVSKLADYLVGTVVPAFSRFGDYIQSNVMPAVKAFASELSSRLQPFLAKVGDAVRQFLPVLQAWGRMIMTQIVPAVAGLVRYLAGKLMPVFSQVASIITTKVIPIVVKLAQFFMGTLVPAVMKIVKAVAKNLKPVFDELVNTYRKKVLPTLVKLLAKFEEWRPTIQKVIVVVVKVMGAVLKFASAILGKVLPVVIRLAGWLLSKLVPAITKVIGFIVKIIGKIIDFGQALFKAWGKANEFRDKVISAVASIPGKIKDLAGKFKEAGAHIIGAMVDGLKNAGGVISGIAGNVWTAVKGLLNSAITQINSALSFTISLPGPDISINPPDIPHLAKGGIVRRPTLALIGEDGPEAVVPLGAKNRPKGGFSLGGGGTTVNNFYISGAMDEDATARKIERVLTKLSRSSGRPLQFTTL